MGRDRYLYRQLVLLTAAVALPLLGLLGYNLWVGVKRAQAAAHLRVQSHASAMARDTDALLFSTDQYLRYLSRQPLIAALDSQRCDPILQGVVQRRPHFANVLVLDRTGAPVCTSITGPGPVPRTFAPFIPAAAPSDPPISRLSRPFLAPIAQRHVVAMSHPIAADGTPRGGGGMAVVLIDLESLHRSWMSFDLPPGSRLSLIDVDGTVISTQPDFTKWVGKDVGAVVATALRENPGGLGLATGIDGVRRVFAGAPLSQAGWRAFAALPETEVLAASSEDMRRNLLLGTVVVAFSVGLALASARRLTRPLAQLASTAEAVAAGDVKLRADAAGRGEFGTVARAFNGMLDAMLATQSRLSESERRLTDLFMHVEMLSVMLDRDARIVQVNDHALTVTGWSREKLVGSIATEHLLADEGETALSAFKRVMQEGDLRRPVLENRIRTRDGRHLWIRWHSSLLRSTEGAVAGMASLGEDITSVREAEERERRQLSFYAALSRTNGAIVRNTEAQALFEEICRICVEHGHASIAYICLVEGTHAHAVAWSGPAMQFLQTTGFSLDPAQLEGRSMTSRAIHSGRRCVVDDVYATDATLPWRERGERIGTRSVAAFPFRRGGQVIGALTLHMTATGFFDERVIALMDEVADDLSFALDNLERAAALMRTQEHLQRREQQVTGLLETAMDAIITIDAGHRIRMFNRAAAHMFGVDADDALGQDVERFVPARLRDVHRRHIGEFAATGSTARRMGALHTLTGLRGNGEEFPIEASISKLGDGEEALMTVVIRDATELRAAEQARLARVAAESASRAKNDFLSRMSHELRTPLNAVLGFSQLLQSNAREALSARQAEQVEHIRRAGWHLLALINDVLDVSQIEAGKLRVEERNVDLRLVIDEALELSAPVASRHGVRLVDTSHAAERLLVRADPVRLRQVLINLISNGIKYNRDGGTVSVDASPHDGGVRIRVVDDGIGMDAHQLAQLYEPFNRLGRERAQVEGTGLGLALTRQLMLLMNGRIGVRSEAGAGTEVEVWLPAGVAAGGSEGTGGESTPSDAKTAAPAGRVLYIEDNPVNMLLVEQLLSRWPDVHLLQAHDGAAGIELARSAQPDVVLLDMRLPDLDGLSVLRSLRGASETRRLRVIALSANAMPDEIEAARQAGADDYWTKPLDFSRFLKEMERMLQSQGTDA